MASTITVSGASRVKPIITRWDHYQLLCRILGSRLPDHAAHTTVRDCFESLEAVATQQNVLPALAQRCEEIDSVKQVMGIDQRERIHAALRQSIQRKLQITSQALKLARVLNRIDVEPLFLKGTALLLGKKAQSVEIRKQVDIDFMVPADSLETVWQVLVSDGYYFLRTHNNQSVTCTDFSVARSESSHHHHLPPLFKDGYACPLELHTHFLPRRFQKANPVNALFADADTGEQHGARYRIPSTEHHIIHLVLGSFVHDGFSASQQLPLRQALDLTNLVAAARATGHSIDWPRLHAHCGKNLEDFTGLVGVLIQDAGHHEWATSARGRTRLLLMRWRWNSKKVATCLDVFARADYLLTTALNNPRKLPTYLLRRLGAAATQQPSIAQHS